MSLFEVIVAIILLTDRLKNFPETNFTECNVKPREDPLL